MASKCQTVNQNLPWHLMRWNKNILSAASIILYKSSIFSVMLQQPTLVCPRLCRPSRPMMPTHAQHIGGLWSYFWSKVVMKHQDSILNFSHFWRNIFIWDLVTILFWSCGEKKMAIRWDFRFSFKHQEEINASYVCHAATTTNKRWLWIK